MKPALKAATATLKLIYMTIEDYNLKTKYYSGLKIFRPVQNNHTVIDNRNKLNKAILVSKFVFSTLSTNIAHHELKSVMVYGSSISASLVMRNNSFESLGMAPFGVIVNTVFQQNYLLHKFYFSLGNTVKPAQTTTYIRSPFV